MTKETYLTALRTCRNLPETMVQYVIDHMDQLSESEQTQIMKELQHCNEALEVESAKQSEMMDTLLATLKSLKKKEIPAAQKTLDLANSEKTFADIDAIHPRIHEQQ